MKTFGALSRRFCSDERGAFLVIFGVIAITLVAMAGAVVDFTMMQQARNRAQVALDAAVLALQPQIYSQSEEQLRASAEAVLIERLDDPAIEAEVRLARSDTTDGRLYLEAHIDVPTAFVTLVGVHSIPARLIAEATRRRLNVEVAMVLDNSSSMNQQNRMGNLKTAARNAADILFSNQDTQPNVFVGVVPFTEFVNVGTANRNAAWIDQTGVSPLSAINFDTDDNSVTPYAGPVNRFDVYRRMGATWRGCVEARMAPYDTNDTAPDINDPRTLFVAALAPDEPDTRDNRGRDVFGNNYLSDMGGSCGYPANTGLAQRERQERLCKYQGANVANNREGPNADCPIASVLALTNQRQAVKGRINDMVANGYTNIHQGAMWGFHMLSPNAPLTEARAHDSATYKVMILMTDGENTHPSANTFNGSQRYVAYGYPSNGRLTGTAHGSLTADMDQLTMDTCDNAKRNNQITIFTIGLNPPNQATRDMLSHCATSSDHDFFPTDPSELNGIFTTIANQLSNLRLAQ
jgi:Flp pilus assembly protein TadG